MLVQRQQDGAQSVSSKSDKPNRFLSSASSESGAKFDVAVKAILDAVAPPGVGPVIEELWKTYTEGLQRRVREEGEQRLKDFVSELLTGPGLGEERATALFDDRDFHALVRACVTDIEAEKTLAYAHMARSIAAGSVEKQWRRHFILSLRDLSAVELAMLRGALVTLDHDVKPKTAGLRLEQDNFLKVGQAGSPETIWMKNLEARGFVAEGRLTRPGELFTRACWPERELTPSAIEHEAWKDGHLAITLYQSEGDQSQLRLAFAIQERLRAFSYKAWTGTLRVGDSMAPAPLLNAGVFLFDGRQEVFERYREDAKFFTRKVPTLLVNLTDVKLDAGDVQFSATFDASKIDANTTAVEVTRRLIAMVGDGMRRSS